MRWLNWWVGQLRRRLGWTGMSGIVLLSAAGALHWWMLTREAPYHHRLLQTSVQLNSALRMLQEQPQAPERLDAVETFYRALPPSTTEQYAGVIASLQAAAVAEGLLLEQASYVLNGTGGESLQELEIVVPVKGAYLQVRRFMARALSGSPGLALEAISFNRQTATDAAVDAQLRFTLYLQKP